MFRRDFTSCCGSANRSSWTAGVTSGVGRDGAQEDDPSSQLTLAAKIWLTWPWISRTTSCSYPTFFFLSHIHAHTNIRLELHTYIIEHFTHTYIIEKGNVLNNVRITTSKHERKCFWYECSMHQQYFCDTENSINTVKVERKNHIYIFTIELKTMWNCVNPQIIVMKLYSPPLLFGAF